MFFLAYSFTFEYQFEKLVSKTVMLKRPISVQKCNALFNNILDLYFWNQRFKKNALMSFFSICFVYLLSLQYFVYSLSILYLARDRNMVKYNAFHMRSAMKRRMIFDNVELVFVTIFAVKPPHDCSPRYIGENFQC